MTPLRVRPIFSHENGLFIDRKVQLAGAALAFAVWMALGWASPAWADSRSKTVTISCVVPAVIEIATPRSLGVPFLDDPSSPRSEQPLISMTTDESVIGATTNLGRKYQLSKESKAGPLGPRQLYTLTAL